MNSPDQKVIAALYLKGKKLAPQEVTAELGVQPTTSHACGEARQTSAGSAFVTKTGLWALVVDRDAAEVSAAVTDLLAALGHQSALTALSNVDEAYFDIFVAALSDEDGDGTCGFKLSVAHIVALAEYGVPVRFTVNMGQP